jgi:hypothetical protein
MHPSFRLTSLASSNQHLAMNALSQGGLGGSEAPLSLNDDDSLWTNLDIEGMNRNFIRTFRATACPVMGDDDVDEADDDDDDDARP